MPLGLPVMTAKHILQASQFQLQELMTLRHYTKEISLLFANGQQALSVDAKPYTSGDKSRLRHRLSRSLRSQILCSLFLEPSTRTRLSFEKAMYALGGKILHFTSPEWTSLQKGESIQDTMRILQYYADILVARLPTASMLQEIIPFSRIPIINAGNGDGEHPTQALLDFYTLSVELAIKNAKIVFLGDLRYSRCVHSLVFLLKHFPEIRLTLISHPSLALPDLYITELRRSRIQFLETESLEQAKEADAIYVTRYQKERFPDAHPDFSKIPHYHIDAEFIKSCVNPNVRILHPLPRGPELHPNLDSLPNAAYFRAIRYSIFLRMVLILMVLQPEFLREFPDPENQ